MLAKVYFKRYGEREGLGGWVEEAHTYDSLEMPPIMGNRLKAFCGQRFFVQNFFFNGCAENVNSGGVWALPVTGEC